MTTTPNAPDIRLGQKVTITGEAHMISVMASDDEDDVTILPNGEYRVLLLVRPNALPDELTA